MVFNIIKEIVIICLLLILVIWAIKCCIKEVVDMFKAQKYLFKAVLDNQAQAKEVFIVFKNNVKGLRKIKKFRNKQKEHRDMWNNALENKNKF